MTWPSWLGQPFPSSSATKHQLESINEQISLASALLPGDVRLQGDLPITESVARSTLALPFSSVMTEEQVEYVCENLIAVLRRQPFH